MSVRIYANMGSEQRNTMPRTKVVFYRERDGSVPLLEWFDELPAPAIVKCRLKLERLKELGYELRRPEADFLREGIYELRIRLRRVNSRMMISTTGKRRLAFPTASSKRKRFPQTKSTALSSASKPS
jgi:Phage derived protein Gp49-like (DUF891)